MTAPENTRERVAEALAEHRLPGFTICGCGVQIGDPLATSSSWEAGHLAHQADALLPLIDTLLREQAEGIAALADEWETKHADHVRAAVVAESELIAALQMAAGSVRKLCADELRARTFGGER